jgi:predicted nucleotide-binding protein
MYSLFIGYAGPNDPDDSVEVSVSRFLEYTDDETQMRFRDLTGDAARTILEFPALFMHEHYEDGAFVADISAIKQVGRAYKVDFRRNTEIGVISPDVISAAALELNIGEYEFYRTHWAVKQGDLIDILSRHQPDLNKQRQLPELPENLPATDDSGFNKSQVFIVHGHDEHAKADAKAYVESRGLEPIILHLQASGGRTIIEKIDHYTNVGFGIVLYTECDVGAKRDSLAYKWRARQNVVFEHGYLIAKLARARVAALDKGDVETPNDISGVVYIGMDAAKKWHDEMDNELRQAGYEISSPA